MVWFGGWLVGVLLVFFSLYWRSFVCCFNFPFLFQVFFIYCCMVDVAFGLFCLCVHYKFLTNKSQRAVNQNKYLGLGFLFERGL